MGDLVTGLQVHRWGALALLAGLLAVGVVCTEVVPRAAGLVGQWRHWRVQQRKVASAAQWEVEKTHLQVRRLYLQQYFEDLYVSLPKSDQMSVILQVLQERAGEREVMLRQVRPAARVAHAGYDELPFWVELQGSFHGIGAFIDRIERSQYLIKVTDLEIRGEPVPHGDLQAAVSLRVIILKEKRAS